MKIPLLFAALLALPAAAPAQPTPYIENFAGGRSVGPIPDGNPIGVTFPGTVSDIPAGFTVGALTVGLDLSGGFNGNLYAYLVAPGGTQVVLLNEPGVAVDPPLGASGPGMTITLQDGVTANGSIQDATSPDVLTGTYNAAAPLAAFVGSPADGTRNLFFADEVSGGGTSTLESWTLNITTVPEPSPAALEIWAGLLLTGGLLLKRRRPNHGIRRNQPRLTIGKG